MADHDHHDVPPPNPAVELRRHPPSPLSDPDMDLLSVDDGSEERAPAGDTVPDAKVKRRPVCAITGRETRARDGVRLGQLASPLAERIRRDHPDFTPDTFLSHHAVAHYRTTLVGEMLHAERGEITDLEREVIASLTHHETVSENVEDDFDEHRTLGDRASDRLASFGGSWAFIISFGVVLIVWMAINVAMGSARSFDPYPFILLNLVLSCIAAVQAPIIMMSQKRQDAKDRMRSLNDYRVTLKAELEIRQLHEKMDHLVKRQWDRLATIQQMQLELLEELTDRRGRRRKASAGLDTDAVPAEAGRAPEPS